jgi:hypothetical protein
MKIINYFFIAYFISILPANAQLFGGQIKTKNPLINQYPAGSVFCNGPTAIVDVTSPTGKIWMDRNLGANQVATSSNDENSYGDLYQWGRRSDGHQCRTSPTTSTLSSSDHPGHGNFILPNSPFDWRSPQNSNLWQGVNGVNNPCPSGYRLPTEVEFNLELTSWSQNNSTGAFASPLKMPLAGRRLFGSGSLSSVSIVGYYWSSTFAGTKSADLYIGNFDAFMNGDSRGTGTPVRCIKDASAIIGTVNSINCGTATNTGTLTQGTAASSVSSSIPYTGGNGGSHSGQTITSTGVTGLTATLSSGAFANGSGTLVYSISGTPSASGTASFALNIGGQTCSLSISVAINLATQYPSGSVFCASGPTAIVDVTSPTGKIWMDRNLGATQVATSATDAAAYGDLYQWGRGNDGHQCRNSLTANTLSSVDQPAHGNHISAPNSPFDWRSPQNTNLWQGVNGVNNPCPSGYRLPTEIEFDEERLSWNNNTSAGAFDSPLKLTVAGGRHFNSNLSLVNVGNLGDYYTSTISSTNSRNLAFNGNLAYMNSDYRADGDSIRCIKDASAIPATIGALSVGSATITGTLINGIAASGVGVSVPYTGGSGGAYTSQTISSTGVSGLTATLTSGILANGSGSLTYTISGTPSSTGTASFAITIGGQTGTFNIPVAVNYSSQYPSGSVFCASGPTAIVDVTSPTGKIWMDRNLGATQVATTATDAAAYGDLYQWGRGNDGHQCRNSSTTSTLSSTDQAGNGSFITASPPNYDWRSPQNNNLWQGVNGVNNPCPSGYRLPTETELNAEITSWSQNNSEGTFSSPLKFTKGGNRDGDVVDDVGTIGRYSSSTVGSTNSQYLFISGSAFMSTTLRAFGISVRCIKDASAIPATVGALNCSSSTITGSITSGTAASGVSVVVPYTAGNGGSYLAQSISSTGVTGLTATLSSGTLAYGSGTLSFAISGTPSASGTASFALTLGGQSCSFTISVQIALAAQYPANSVFCASGPTAIVDVTSPTGKIWMDRNLGASHAATSSTDVNSYGDLYQWGRGNDGHQCRNSATTTSPSSSNQPGHGNFILSSGSCTVSPYGDWRNPQNTNLWQGVTGTNNPCPNGYSIPTEAEIWAEVLTFNPHNTAGAFSSLLKLTRAGERNFSTGTVTNTIGRYWTSTINAACGAQTQHQTIGFNSISISDPMKMEHSQGCSLRCIKDASSLIGTVNSIICDTATNTGTLTQGTAASGVSTSVPYTGGNGGSHSGQTVTSTGVTGLTATLSSGAFANGSGSIVYNITGTPSSSGIASFAISIGGQTCTYILSIPATLSTVTTNPATTITYNSAISGGNVTSDGSSPVTVSGFCWSTNPNPTISNNILNVSSGIGSFNATITGLNGNTNYYVRAFATNSSGTAYGNEISFATLNAPSPINCAPSSTFTSPQLNSMGVIQAYSGQQISLNHSSAYNSWCVSSCSFFNNPPEAIVVNSGCGNSNINETIIINQPGIYSMYSCVSDCGNRFYCYYNIEILAGPPLLTTSYSANNITNNSIIVNGEVTGDGGSPVTVSGFFWSTNPNPTISNNILNVSSGIGSFNATITGLNGNTNYYLRAFATNSSGTAYGNEISFTTQSIPSFPTGTIFCNNVITAVIDVTNPTTGKTWMDRNLGASQVATSSADALAYGDLYQWGRRADGHQCRNSITTTTLSSTDQPGNGNFIIISNTPYDWRSTQNDNLWQGINGTNNPCPNGYRIPTENELEQERLSWSSNDSFGAFNSPLKLSMTGYRNVATGVLTLVNERGYYWSSTINGTSSRNLIFSSTQNAWHADDIRGSGETVRCIKN